MGLCHSNKENTDRFMFRRNFNTTQKEKIKAVIVFFERTKVKL